MRSPLTLLPKAEFHLHIKGSLDVDRDRLWRLTVADMLTENRLLESEAVARLS